MYKYTVIYKNNTPIAFLRQSAPNYVILAGEGRDDYLTNNKFTSEVVAHSPDSPIVTEWLEELRRIRNGQPKLSTSANNCPFGV